MRNASLIEITRQAGQRNRSALNYHFGSRDGVLCAVLDRHVAFLAQREGELLAVAATAPVDDVASVVEAIVRPAAELAECDWRGRCCLLIIAELAEEDPATFSPELASVLDRTGGNAVYALLATRMADVSPEVRVERFALHHHVRAARGGEPGPGARHAESLGPTAARLRDVRAEPRRDGRGRDVRTGRALEVSRGLYELRRGAHVTDGPNADELLGAARAETGLEDFGARGVPRGPRDPVHLHR